jgi:hypothetical protein
MKQTDIPKELVEIIKVGVRAYAEVPGSVALGGSIVALSRNHRAPVGVEFVVSGLIDRFQ